MSWRMTTMIAIGALSCAGCGSDETGNTSANGGGGGGVGGESNEGGSATTGSGTGGTGGTSEGDGGSESGGAPSCTTALEQALAPVDAVSKGQVKILSTEGTTRTLYVDASAGGVGAQGDNPWIYLSLADGTRVDVTDPDSLTSIAWDLGIKRPLLRTNDGDVGPGHGGAVLLDGKTLDEVTDSEAHGAAIQIEHWFDASCKLHTDPTGAPETTFAGWYDYDPATHVLGAHKGTFVVRGADGALYKVQILDYYATPEGGSAMSDGGFFKLEVAPVP